MQNCPHSDDGWCLKCVRRLGDSVVEYLDNPDPKMERYLQNKVFGALCNDDIGIVIKKNEPNIQ